MAKASSAAIMKIIAGRKEWKPPAVPSSRSFTYSPAPSESVIAFSVQAKVRISIAGTMERKPSGRQSMQSLKLMTLLMR